MLKDKERKDYAFQREFSAKPSIALGCPGLLLKFLSRVYTGVLPQSCVLQLCMVQDVMQAGGVTVGCSHQPSFEARRHA